MPTITLPADTFSAASASGHTITLGAPLGTPLIASGNLRPGDTGKTINLSDAGASWTAGTPGTPTFTISKSPTNDAVKNSQVVLTATTATLNVDAGATAGVITITDPGTGKTASLGVRVPSNSNSGQLLLLL